MKRYFLPAAVLATALATVPLAQMRIAPVDYEQGHVALGLVLRHLANAGIYMMATAHPDDENNGLLVLLNRGQGYRTALATATRGNGGQNEIGPELFEPLGVLRTEELAALHRFDGAEQYFTRAVDFGYTIDLEETLRLWGRDEIIGDYVRLIRTIRPDVVSAQNPLATGPGQHAHHALAAMLSHEAYKVAGDAASYPEQIQQGLRPWQPRKFYFTVGGPGGGNPQTGTRVCRVDLAIYDSLLGRTYSEIGTEARSMHKCQGQAQLLALPGPSAGTFSLAASTIPGQLEAEERTLFDGVDTSIAGLAKFAADAAPAALASGLDAVSSSIRAAQAKFDTESDGATVQPLLEGLRALRALRADLRTMSVSDDARYEIDFRLGHKEREFQEALIAANGLRIEALADDGVVVPGQPVRITVIVANHGATPVDVSQVKFEGFAADAVCTLTAATAGGGPGGGGQNNAAAPAAPPISTLGGGQVARCTPMLTVPADARVSEPYWHRLGEAGRYTFDADAPFGLPFRPTPFNLHVTLRFPSGDDIVDRRPVQYRYEGNIFSGEKRMDLLIAPSLSVSISPDVAIVPTSAVRPAGSAAAATREIRVTVINDSAAASESDVALELPQGWTASPSQQAVKFTRQDESRTVRFQIRPAAAIKPGEFRVRAIARSGGQIFDRGFQVIEYSHIRRQHIYAPASARLKVLDVRTAPNLVVGYVMGSGDEVAPFIEQLGARVEMLGPDALAWGDLSRFDTIVLGVRAYERRDDLRANNSRLLEYVENGGTVVVQYNRAAIQDAYGPYPAQISNNRITDEGAPVRILVPTHPVFTTPNKLSDSVWSGWVQERGLNFLGEKDSRYRDLVELTDPFPNNAGPKRGALVEAIYGKGRWIYVALGLWRELPAGVDGAYPILANLISLGKTPVAAAAPGAARPATAPAAATSAR
jgi:LmbE family N-acetylglucosaminyl deacetylase